MRCHLGSEDPEKPHPFSGTTNMEHYGIKIPNTIRVFTKDTKHKELFYALIYETMSKLPAGDPTNKITATIEALLDSVIANKFGDDPEDIKQGVERYLAQADAKHNNAAWPSLLMTTRQLWKHRLKLCHRLKLSHHE